MALGRAYIEVHADTRPFGRELRDDIDAYLAEADIQMQKGGKRIGANFSESVGSETTKGLGNVAKDFEHFGGEAEKISRDTGQKVRRGLKKGLDDSENDVKGWTSRLGNYMSSWAFNSVTGIQSWAGQVGNAISSPGHAIGIFVGLIGLVLVAMSALIPIVAALGTSFLLLAGGVGALGAVFLPLFLLFKDLSPLLTKMSDSTHQWNKDLKTIPAYLRPIATVFRDIYNTIKSLNLKDFVTPLLGPLKTLDSFLKSNSFKTFFSGLAKEAGIFFSGILSAFQTPAWNKALKGFFVSIDQIVSAVMPVIREFANTLAMVFNDPKFQQSIVGIVSLIAQGATKFLDWIQGAVKNGSFDRWLNQVNGIFYSIWGILGALGPLIAAFTTPQQMHTVTVMLNDIKATIDDVSAFLASKKGQQFISDMINLFGIMVTAALGVVIALSVVDSNLHSVWNFLKGLPGQVKSAWSGMASIIGSAWNIAANGVIAAINRVIDGINRLISAYNAIPFVSNVPKIPHLSGTTSGANSSSMRRNTAGGGGGVPKAMAAGGIVNSPQLSMIGEAGREVVIPLTNRARAMALADQSGLTSMLRGDNTVTAVTVMVNLDGTPFYNYVAKAFSNAGKQLATGPRQ